MEKNKFMEKDIWVISEEEKKVILSILLKGETEQEKNKDFAIIEFEDFYRLFDPEEIVVIKKFLSIDLKRIGYKLPIIGVSSHLELLVPIRNQIFFENGKKMKMSCQYLPKKTLNSYLKLNKVIKKDIGKKLLVQHGYRSPARQVFIFFEKLGKTFNFQETLKRVSFPDYSEHVCTKRQAIDFMTETGIKSDGFDKTEEYQWLKINANRFRFYESYPKNNKLDMVYEPWHWHYE